jgi:hypothetical protein
MSGEPWNPDQVRRQYVADDLMEADPAKEAAADPPPEPAGEPEDGAPEEDSWAGSALEAYRVGDPGRAAREVVAGLSENPTDPADTQVDGATIGTMVVRAASCRGTSHRHSGTPRQDDYALCTGDGRWLVAAVADGVSAGALSHQAATIASRGASALVRDALIGTDDLDAVPWDDVFSALARRIVAHGRRAITSDDAPADITPAQVATEMATTLVVAALSVAAREDGSRDGVVIALGDTSVFLLASDGTWWPITDVKNEGAEIASSATLALPYLPAVRLEPIRIRLRTGDSLFVMTDGVGDPLGRGDGPVGEFLASVWGQPPDMLTFGGQVGFARKSFDDDRTVVGIWARA